MPPGNEGRYRSMIDAFNERDVDRLLEFCDPAIEFTSLLVDMGGVFHGHDGIRTWFADLADTLRPTLEVRRVEEHGDVVVVVVDAHGVGVGSGVDLDWVFFQALRYRDGLLVWAYTTQEEDAARSAAGLEPS